MQELWPSLMLSLDRVLDRFSMMCLAVQALRVALLTARLTLSRPTALETTPRMLVSVATKVFDQNYFPKLWKNAVVSLFVM